MSDKVNEQPRKKTEAELARMQAAALPSEPAAPQEENIVPHSSRIYTDLTVRCHGCSSTLMWRYLEDKDEIEVFHCANKVLAEEPAAPTEIADVAQAVRAPDLYPGDTGSTPVVGSKFIAEEPAAKPEAPCRTNRFALRCPHCDKEKANSKDAGGNEKCFHCGECGFTECEWSSPAHDDSEVEEPSVQGQPFMSAEEFFEREYPDDAHRPKWIDLDGELRTYEFAEAYADAWDYRFKEMSACLERERTQVAEGVKAIKDALNSREWLTEGRGPYEWDDDRWHGEFAAACKEIFDALKPLEKIARDFQFCPTTQKEIADARDSAKHSKGKQ